VRRAKQDHAERNRSEKILPVAHGVVQVESCDPEVPETVMYDILDAKLPARRLGTISGLPYRLAKEALKALKEFGVPTLVFTDVHGVVYAQPAANATEHPVDEIVGIYGGTINADDIADDIRASVGPRLAAIGILVNWQDASTTMA
jgi:hypothetical protein